MIMSMRCVEVISQGRHGWLSVLEKSVRFGDVPAKPDVVGLRIESPIEDHIMQHSFAGELLELNVESKSVTVNNETSMSSSTYLETVCQFQLKVHHHRK